jgi:hypothetical protein
MKSLITIFATILIVVAVFLPNQVIAQAPDRMSYQSVIRGTNNALVANQSVRLHISILQGSITGSAVYSEQHQTTTNSNGLVTISIGAGTSPTGSFSAINWENGPYFVKMEADPTGGTNYTVSGTSQLLSVPYALHANTATIAATATTAANGVPVGGSNGQVLTNCNGVAVWTNGGLCPASITALNCSSASANGALYVGFAANGVSSSVPYTGGNGGIHSGQTVASTGVTGLTATLVAGTIANGSGSLTYTISGTPSAVGTASFALNIGGKICTLSRMVTNQTLAVTTTQNDQMLSPYICGGTVTSTSQDIVERGILYGQSQTLDYNSSTHVGSFQYGLSYGGSIPTPVTSRITSGSGTGNFAVNIHFLFGNVQYYFCAYAKTASGTIVKGQVLSITNRTYSRSTQSPDYANVFWNPQFNLFDLLTDEIITPDINGVYKFYYSSNENPNVYYKELHASQLPNFLFYKFKTSDSCLKWTQIHKGLISPN